MAVNFFTAGISYQLRDKEKIRTWLLTVFRKEGFRLGSLNIILCSDEYLYKMNVQYLKHKTYTDIITFGNADKQGIINGELYISLDRIRENAKTFSIFLRDELHRVIVHGALHLCGYDDKTPKKKAIMSAKEDFFLSLRKFI